MLTPVSSCCKELATGSLLHLPLLPALDEKAPVTREVKGSTLFQEREQQMLTRVHMLRVEAKSMAPQRHLDQTNPVLN